MWLTDLLRKITKGPRVGETFRDYIGCYLYGSDAGGGAQPEYVGAPTTVAQLEDGLRTYLQDYLSTQPDPSAPGAVAVQALLSELPTRLQAHLATDMTTPLLTIGGTELFVRPGVRQRRREKGRFIE